MNQQLIQAIQELPSEVLPELASFVEYLKFKSTLPKLKSPSSSFLLGIAGLGSSGESDISDRDEEILAKEVSPLQGWSIKVETQI
ncbi:hypothetical protein V2H45_15735 [Tumidithrix elongata RA019]|uniref:DUF2281 domain-containing protein n=1 Tax=Tumidithrix elongata BACA0141 TaxID=2716417 RepID=A0AAW9Q6D7_9CYAN|nr:hypothetical protein [Tumidithrix elongata RA019]